MNPEAIREILTQVKFPGFSRDIVSFGLVRDIRCEPGLTTVKIEVQTRDAQVPERIFKDCHAVLDAIPGIGEVKVEIEVKDAPAAGGLAGTVGKSSIPGVKRVIAIASGKGGVGKSTVASNLAVALAATGARVGLCDCDLYGPSVAQMFGVNERPMANVIVRGPMATRYTQQFLRQVAWDELDYLILDLPPGTGDIQLTIVQTVSVDGVIIVTTPQEVALIDARKAVSMFAKVNVPVLGLIENMAWFECDAGKRYYLFGEGGGVREAQTLDVPLLGRIPIDIATREGGDSGTPVASRDPGANKVSAAFHQIAAVTRSTVPVS
ncbi:MAG: Mrp/NBP35 family ATP-binding protein [Akkermansiaceae bacterium]|nr:Mrp/NBP35 family ATP-binding protein [Akkermansiaceae bacterium]